MQKVKVLSRALAIGGVLAIFFPLIAHAGGGQGGGGASIEGFQCYHIEKTANQPHVVTLDDQFGTRDHVRISSGRLLCTPTIVTLEKGTDTGEFDNAFGGDHLKCYDIRPVGRGAHAMAETTDPIDVETVKVGGPTLLCVFAFKEVLPATRPKE
jgi:hypothetical protein